MTKAAGLGLFLATAVLFFIANRAAYQGYFQDDELDNMSWTRDIPLADFATTTLTPRFLGNNFRPVGHLFFRLMAERFGLRYAPYVLAVHLLHLANIWLLWTLVRRLGAPPLASAAGTLLFAFHMGAFDAVWKPMYIFDVFCAFFSLASLLLYVRRRIVLSFCAFWLAYKSKELAVMLPAVLACWEFWLGERRWKPLAPFFAASISFGVQGMLLNPNVDNDYTLRFSPAAIWKSTAFYSSKLLLIPFAGLALLALPFLSREARVRFGIAAMALFFVPLLVLPGRLFGAYCYLPITGLAIAASGVPPFSHAVPAALLLTIWLPLNYYHLRANRRYALSVAGENRAYVTTLADFARQSPESRVFVYDGRPQELRQWGIHGALRCVFRRPDIELKSIADKDVRKALDDPRAALLSWDAGRRKLAVMPRGPDVAFIEMGPETPIWQLGDGWFGPEGRFRWIEPVATARLLRPAGARRFEVTLNISPLFIREVGRTEVEVSIDGRRIGAETFTTNGWLTVGWPVVPEPSASIVEVRFRVEPGYQPSSGDPRKLGIPIVSFGFRP
ncbi:MAG: hypothetical protein ACRD8O_05335 [Bryobacteraceae bacterium]